MKIERRLLTTELRASKSGSKTKLSGYAAVFNSDSEDLGGFTEQIAPGAFRDVLASASLDCRCLLNHDPNMLLGRTPNTLRLRQDSHGLFYECDIPDTNAGRDVLVSAERGDISQSSFGFTVADEQWFDLSGNKTDKWSGSRRLITKVGSLFDVSPVTYPAYQASSVEARDAFLFPSGRPQGRADGSAGLLTQEERDTITKEAARQRGYIFLEKERARTDAKRQFALTQIQEIRSNS
jgi:HK97 family phage prohead protease